MIFHQFEAKPWIVVPILFCFWKQEYLLLIHHECTTFDLTRVDAETPRQCASIGTEAQVHDTQLIIMYPCHKTNIGSANLLVNKASDRRDVSLAARCIPLNTDWIHHCSLGPLWTQVLCCQHRDVWQSRADYHMTEWHLLLEQRDTKLDEILMIYHMLLTYRH